MSSPTLLIDKEKCMSNILRMKDKADRNGLILKPHVKTHQSADIGRWMKEAGIQAITVSSVKMALYFAESGWKDITIAFPVYPLEIDAINDLAASVDLSLLISNKSSADLLDKQLIHPVSVYIEIDTGSRRTGFTSDQIDAIQDVANKLNLSDLIHLKGLYSHPGHSYRCRTRQEIQAVHDEVRKQMINLKNKIDSTTRICTGDTPCCSVGQGFEGIDEISPGNFVFYDVMQTQIGSCSYEDIAVALAVPVVAIYPDRNEIAVHGGAVHLSKEHIQTNEYESFGSVVIIDSFGWSAPNEEAYVRKVSQEHGIISCGKNMIQNVQVGDVIGILPVHSCLTADLMMGYHTLDGDRLNHIRASRFYK